MEEEQKLKQLADLYDKWKESAQPVSCANLVIMWSSGTETMMLDFSLLEMLRGSSRTIWQRLFRDSPER